MSKGLIRLVLLVFVLCVKHTAWTQGRSQASPKEPELISIFPLGGQRGTVVQAKLRGRNLDKVHAVWFNNKAFRATIRKIEGSTSQDSVRDGDSQTLREGNVYAEVEIGREAELGRQSLRLVSVTGVSNALPFLVNSDSAIAEIEQSHSKPSEAQLVPVPSRLDGRISRKGELDYYCFEVAKGQDLTFSAVSNIRTNQGGFDAVQLALYEPSGSWFDSSKPTRLAFSDQPRLGYRFEKSGRYLLEVGTYLGIGGLDCFYQLRIGAALESKLAEALSYQGLPSAIGSLRSSFTRELRKDRLQQVWARTVRVAAPRAPLPDSTEAEKGKREARSSESIVPEAADVKLASVVEREPNDLPDQTLQIGLPMLIEGAIGRPGDVDSFRFRIKKGQGLAFEIETPDASPPEFNPKFEVLDSSGQVLLSNVYRYVGGDGDDWIKLIRPKAIFTFEREDECLVRIRDITSRMGDPAFKYRILIRPQIPHVGRIELQNSHLNLVAGEARKLTVVTEQEEGFDGEIAIAVDNLPPGVQALAAAESEPEKPPPLPEIDKGLYFPRSKKVTILIVCSADAPATTVPQMVRLVARPVVSGQLGDPLPALELPLMVVTPDREKTTGSPSTSDQENKGGLR